MASLSVSAPGEPGGRRSFDLKDLEYAESRLHEVALVTPEKAPELLQTFLSASFTLSTHYRDLHFLHRKAEKRAGDRRAIIVVDLMNERLAEKKLKDNETSRDAIIEVDPQYSQYVDEEMECDAALRYVDRKLRDCEATVGAIKRILDASSAIFWRANPNLATGGFDQKPQPPKTPAPEMDIPDSIFGAAAYAATKSVNATPATNTVTKSGFKIGRATY